MKQYSISGGSYRIHRSGSALLIVLGMTALLTILVVAFLIMARTEFLSSNSYNHGVNTKILSETAVNTVIAQIIQATRSQDALTGKTVAWASQPGMIRTFDDTGMPASYYKLYSWDNMSEIGQFDPTTDTASFSSWASEPDVFTDLNEPVNGTYPIIAGVDSKGNALAPYTVPDDSGKSVLTYESITAGSPDVEGFWIEPASTPAVPASDPNPIPMPVKWLYVLQDGTLLPGVSNGASGAAVAGAAGRRIVGRIAFWTDDETAKVNINTASEGIFWDTPICAGQDEMNLAADPPVQNEFQRTSGHPATTCLSSVFTDLAIDHNLPPANTTTLLANLNSIYSFTPRIASGGSLAGTAPISDYNFQYAPSSQDVLNMTLPSAITPNGNRLFDNVDEALFVDSAVSSGGKRTVQPSLITKVLLQQDNFFLTANSRAPEVTLFNTPRISLWPITWPFNSLSYQNNSQNPIPVPTGQNPSQPLSNDSWIAPQEQLLAFCSSLNNFRFFFQRQNPDSPTSDFNNIQRNQDLLSTYLRPLMSKNIPGMGGTFVGKYGQTGADYLLVNAFDFIRAAINLNTVGLDSSGSAFSGYHFAGFNYWHTGMANTLNKYPSVQVAPIRASLGGTEVKGYGEYPTLTQADLLFYASAGPQTGADANNNPVYAPARNDPYPMTSTGTKGPFDSTKLITASKPQTNYMTMVLLVNYSLPSAAVGYTPEFWIKATGAPFQVNGSIGFPAGSNPTGRGNIIEIADNNTFTGTSPLSALYDDGNNPKALAVPTSSGGSGEMYQFVSNPIVVSGASTFSFTGTPVTFQIYAADPTLGKDVDPTGNPLNFVQTIVMDFSKCNGTYPVPLAPRWVEGQPLPPAVAGSVNHTGSSTNPIAACPDREVAPDPGQSGASYCYQVDDATTSPSAPVGTFISPLFINRLSAGHEGPGWFGKNPNFSNGSALAIGYPFSPINNFNASINQIIGMYDTVFGLDVDAKNGAAKGDVRVLGGIDAQPISNLFNIAYTGSSIGYIANGFDDANYLQGLSGSAPYATHAPRTTAGWQRHTLTWYAGNLAGLWGSGAPCTNFSPNASTKVSLFNIPTASWGQQIGGEAAHILGKGPTPGTQSQTGEVGAYAFGLTENLNTIGSLGGPPGDFMNAPGYTPDGGFLCFPDQNYQTLARSDDGNLADECWVPFFESAVNYQGGGSLTSFESYFSPSRQVASPIILGSIPEPDATGTPQPWKTLLFCPNPVYPTDPKSEAPHAGFGVPYNYPPYTTIPDHLFLDLFWMPVVEPYPISEAFSTAGQVNLNYQIVPFTYINRETGLYAVMKSVKITAIPSNVVANGGTTGVPGAGTIINDYKNCYQMRLGYSGIHTRFNIDPAQTLYGFDKVFARKDLFRSASQLCDMFLVPQGQTWDTVSDPSPTGFWANQLLTGANSREAPYNQIYPRITTKSNTFQVHFRVQALTQTAADTAAGIFDSTKGDSIAGEYRGSSIIERYIDPNDSTLPDFAITGQTMDAFYKFRILNTTAFQP